jgi:hypothetical protein
MNDPKILLENVKNKLLDLLKVIEGGVSSEKMPSQLEIDLMKEKFRKAYDLLLQVEPPTYEIPHQTIDTVEKSELTSEIVDESPEIKNEEIIAEEKVGEAEKDHKPEKEKIPIKEPVKLQTSKVDLFSQEESNSGQKKDKTVLDKISETRSEMSVADNIQKKSKIPGLKSAIGINEKFFFINELFKGNMKDYNEAIENLEACQSFDEAANLSDSLKQKYGWKDDSEAFVQLKEIVNRKFN